MASPTKLLSEAGLYRRRLIMFALLTAALNGIMTASVGAWLAQTYNTYQSRRQSMQAIADLVYERRARGGMVVSSLRRGADLDELRHRKRAYDEVFVEWNKRLQTNILQIREVMGTGNSAVFESLLQDLLVPALATMDGCLTRGYDVRNAGQDPLPVIEGCNYARLHQYALDCGASLTDELFRLTSLRFLPFTGHSRREVIDAERRVRETCVLPEPRQPKPTPPPSDTSVAPPSATEPQKGN